MEKATESQVEHSGSRPDSGTRDLGTKIGLAIFSFLLGLLATYINNTFLKDQKRLAYSVSSSPVASVRDLAQLDPDLRQAAQQLRNINEFRIRIENVGDLPVLNFAATLVFSKDARLVAQIISTEPEREVPFNVEAFSKQNELRISSITLDSSQAIRVHVFLASPSPPSLRIYPALARSGKVGWQQLSPSKSLSLEESLIALLRLWVLFMVLPGLITTVPQAIATFFFGIRTRDEKVLQREFLLSVTVLSLISSVIRYYLLFRMLEPAMEVVHQLVAGGYLVS